MSVIWLTGLSGSGKTTLATALCAALEKRKTPFRHLDGDVLRAENRERRFDRESRVAHIEKTGQLAGQLESEGYVVVVSLISPFEEARLRARGHCKNFFEVYVSTPLEVCEARDPKGLYRRARAGEIKNFTGISDPYEVPKNPDLTLDLSRLSVDQAVTLVLPNRGIPPEFVERTRDHATPAHYD